jgi:SAM-dependent methyltransferase
VLEVGCGVGAQTEILLERFPQLKVHGVDASPVQIERARRHLAAQLDSGRVSLDVADAEHLPDPENAYDGAFLCWFLEHVQSPVEILKEVRRVLKSGAVVYCTEVMNFSLFLHPYSPATLKYWFEFNDHQWNLHGDPFVGAKLGNDLSAAGFQDIQTQVHVAHFDDRAPKLRAQFIEYWTSLLLSGAPGLIEAGKVTEQDVDAMRSELEVLKDAPSSVFFYAFMQASARVY